MDEVLYKIEKIRKNFKKTELLFEMIIVNYDKCNLYIRLDYYPLSGISKLSFVDLNIKDDNYKKYINEIIVPVVLTDVILDVLEIYGIVDYNTDLVSEEDLVIINFYTPNHSSQMRFKQSLPSEIGYLENIFIHLFFNLPKRLECFMYEILSLDDSSIQDYVYSKKVSFELFNEPLENLFDKSLINDESSDVKFLEKFDHHYIGAVTANDKMEVVIIELHDKDKIRLRCSCDKNSYCIHVVAIIKAIRKKIRKKFYKIIYRENNDSIYAMINNFDYFLCLGFDKGNLKIISGYDLISVPLLDENEKLMWKVLEDDEKETLTKEIQKRL